jgi:hypothetical protein
MRQSTSQQGPAVLLSSFLGTRLPPSESGVRDIYRETTICYAYMCPYAYGCTEKTARAAQVLNRRCMRYQPEEMRVAPGLSDLALDLLAQRREQGKPVAATTSIMLDHLRPNGPMRKMLRTQ